MNVEIPNAVKICPVCGELSEGASCASCATIARRAVSCAHWALNSGTIGFEVDRAGRTTKAELLFADLAESEFHRVRTAEFNAQLPVHAEGLQPQPAQPGGFMSPRNVRVRLRTGCLVLCRCGGVGGRTHAGDGAVSTRNVMAADRADLGQVPLALAMLCQDCNLISAAQHACPGCASSALLKLDPVINREIPIAEACR